MTSKEHEQVQVRYTTLHYDVLDQLNLSLTEGAVLDTVWKLSLKTGYCFMDREIMAKRLRMTRQGLNKIITRLTARELIVRGKKGLAVTDAYVDIALFVSGNKVSSTPEEKMETKFPAKAKSGNKVSKKRKQSFQQVETKLPNNRGDNNSIELQVELISKSNDLESAGAPKQTYGSPDVNEVMDFWTLTVGYPIQSKVKPNRNAASGLVKKHGMEATKRFIVWVSMAQSDRFATKEQKPVDLVELRSNVSHVYAWAKKKAIEQNNAVPRF